MTGPSGEQLPTQTAPTNTADGTTWNYVGQHQKLTDQDTSPISGGIIQMGARVYIPVLGRFLSVDSVEGGTDNNYVYANDPLNQFDLDGHGIPLIFLQAIPRITVGIIVRVAVRTAVNSAKTYITRAVVPVLSKKMTAAASKIGQTVKGGLSRAAQNIRKSIDYVKSIRVSVQIHAPHHKWGSRYYNHVSINIYRKGTKDSSKRIQIPYGKGCKTLKCKNG